MHDVKSRVLNVFHKSRENSSLHFEEEDLFSYLTNPPTKKNELKNTFKGSKRYHRFMDALELEFGICFRLSELDRCYSLDQLINTIIKRVEKQKGNKIILRQRIAESKNYHIEWTIFIIFLLLFLGIKSLELYWLLILLCLVWFVLMFKMIHARLYERKQLKKMVERLGL